MYSQPKPAAKAQPKPATATKAATGRTAATRGRGGRKPRAQGKPKKSAEELDADMQDYWDTGANGGAAPEGGDTAMATNGGAAAQAAASGGDAGMEDEIMVSRDVGPDRCCDCDSDHCPVSGAIGSS